MEISRLGEGDRHDGLLGSSCEDEMEPGPPNAPVTLCNLCRGEKNNHIR